MGSFFSPPSPPSYTPPPATANTESGSRAAETAAAEARERQRRGQFGTIATSWRGLLPNDDFAFPVRRKSLLGE